MEKKEKSELEELIKQTPDSEEEAQQAEDNEALAEILTGCKEINIEGHGVIVFEQPPADLAIEGDLVVAQFKSKHLSKGDLLTEAQLKAIYSQPVAITVGGEEKIVSQGEWTEGDESLLEDLPITIDNDMQYLYSFRDDIQRHDEEILKLGKLVKNKPKKKSIEKKKETAYNECTTLFERVLNNRKNLLELQTKRLRLFSTSLEEMALLEKVKLYVPSCVKKKVGSEDDFTLVPLWTCMEDMLKDRNIATQIISIYNLFLRGVDISFFDGLLGDQKT